MIIKRIYHRYELWEDYHAGMFNLGLSGERINAAKELLKSPDDLKDAMMKTAFDWKHAAEVNLSNIGRNRQAWLGQSACCLVCGATDTETKAAWRMLSDEAQDMANRVADIVIHKWESEQCLKDQLELMY